MGLPARECCPPGSLPTWLAAGGGVGARHRPTSTRLPVNQWGQSWLTPAGQAPLQAAWLLEAAEEVVGLHARAVEVAWKWLAVHSYRRDC